MSVRRTRAAIGVIVVLLSFVLAGALVAAVPSRGVEGQWLGLIMGRLHIVLHVTRDPSGKLTASMDSPDQGANGLTVDRVEFAGDSLHLALTGIGAGYDGRLDPAGTHLEGVWHQAGQSLPLAFDRRDSIAAPSRPQDPKPPYPYDADEVKVENAPAHVTLAGTLTHPHGSGPFACAVLITGSGQQNRNEEVFGHRPFLVLADDLTRRGIAVLRVDDRGVGGSSPGTPNVTTEDFASDIRACVAYLKTRPDMDARRIGLIGHSEGGLIAPMVAAGSRDIAYIVLLAGPGVPGDQILLAQGEAMQRGMGRPDSEIVREANAQRALFAIARAPGDSSTLESRVRAAVRPALAGADSTAAEVQIRQSLGMVRSAWFRFFLGYDPRPTLRRVRCPVLALNGEKDVQVPPKQNLPEVERALRQGGNRDVTAIEMPRLNHLLQTCTTGMPDEYAKIEETMAPAALDTIGTWVVRHVGSPAPGRGARGR